MPWTKMETYTMNHIYGTAPMFYLKLPLSINKKKNGVCSVCFERKNKNRNPYTPSIYSIKVDSIKFH